MRLIDADKLIFKMEFVSDMSPKGLIKDRVMVSYDNVNEAQTVEAIPIEYILKWANKNCMYCYDYDFPTEKDIGWYDINNMVKDWRKENGLS